MRDDYFQKNFIINNIEYKLTQSELFFLEKGKQDTKKTHKLNELDPCYEFISYFPISTFIWLTIYLGGLLFGLGFFLMNNDSTLSSEQIVRIMFATLLISSLAFSFLYRSVREWRFVNFHTNEIALTFKQSKKNEMELKHLVEMLAIYIKKANKSNQYIVWQLARYGLLTEREHELLSNKVLESKIQQAPSEIVHIPERA